MSRGLISLLDILRAYAEAYSKASHALALIAMSVAEAERTKTGVLVIDMLVKTLRTILDGLLPHCGHLPMTALTISQLIQSTDTPSTVDMWKITPSGLSAAIENIQGCLENELSLNLFFKLPQEKKKYFDTPLDGWDTVTVRFPGAITDIEEMSKCFALSRYAAAVYHACQTIELGLIQLGIFIGVNDPKSGWTAVTNKLETMVKKREDLEQKYKNCYAFLEQTHGVVGALKSAWRNKIDHAQGRLVLMTTDFTPDIAEEIIMVSRAFMRRLATEMP